MSNGDTPWKNRPRDMLPLPVAAFAYAKDELEKGVEELTENSSPEIDTYLEAADLSPGLPWCAAFVNWCAEQAASDEEVISPLEEVRFEGYVQSYYDFGHANDWIIPASEAQIGDIFLLWFDTKERYAHMGFVERVDMDGGTFTTIEGNTNEGGGREGTKIARRRRHISDDVVFLRWSDD